MKNQNQAQLKTQYRSSNFWLGFALASTLMAAVAFFLGTKQGREYFKKILELSENLEENILLLLKKLEEKTAEKTDFKDKPTLNALLEKIKITSAVD